MNTSGNEVIRHFVNSMKEPHMLTKSELEMLVSGDTVTKRVDEMITYKELYASMDNLWSTLFMTGYLTQRQARSSPSHGRKPCAQPLTLCFSCAFPHLLRV